MLLSQQTYTVLIHNIYCYTHVGVQGKIKINCLSPDARTNQPCCCCCYYFNGVSGKLVPFTPVAIRLSYFTKVYGVMLSIACACLLKWEETGVPGGNPRKHGENMQTPHRKARAGPETNPGPSCCEATALTTAPPCRP